ncbi:MAG: NADP-dependent phosphogluconate dehydrogenase, partial [Candidatus Neomarinimicrobiota bacterium]
MDKSDFGLIGLAVMGENLVLNIIQNGYTVSVYNRTVSKVDDFIQGRAKGKKVTGFKNIPDFVASLIKPRKIMMLVKAGSPVDNFIDQLLPFLEKGDLIIDGGNSHFQDTIRRAEKIENKELLYIGTGVSGGEEGALKGPSLMPGGSSEAWFLIKPIFHAIAAKVDNNIPCCDWIGSNGAGHFVKMVHNGIEYGDMQMIGEAYNIMKTGLGMKTQEMQGVFSSWNENDLNSYLIGITAEIMGVKDEDTNEPVLDLILDAAGQKGTGRWTSETALSLGIPAQTIAEAVFARAMSALKDERVAAAGVLKGPVASLNVRK